MRLPDDRHHERIDMARVVEVVLLLLDLRGVGREGESRLLKFEVHAEAPHETLAAVVAPREAAAVHAPQGAHLLLGLETAVGHAVARDEAQRMLRRSAVPGQKRRQRRRRKNISSQCHPI